MLLIYQNGEVSSQAYDMKMILKNFCDYFKQYCLNLNKCVHSHVKFQYCAIYF